MMKRRGFLKALVLSVGATATRYTALGQTAIDVLDPKSKAESIVDGFRQLDRRILQILDSDRIVLAEFDMEQPDAAEKGVIASGPVSADALRPGEVRGFRIIELGAEGTEYLFDGTISRIGGGGDIEMSSVALASGDTVHMSSLVIGPC